MKKIYALISLLLVACGAGATVVNNSQYQVTGLSGPWLGGSSGWNMSSAVNVASANGLMSDGYVDSFTHSVVNGIYAMSPSSITFGTIGGADVLLNSFSFITSRNYSNSTVLSLAYSLNNGAWITAETISSGLLLAPLSSCLSGPNNNCAGQTATMNFGGVIADQWRLSFAGSQVALHEVIIDGGAAVPEPGSLALLGLGLAGLAYSSKRKAQGRPTAE